MSLNLQLKVCVRAFFRQLSSLEMKIVALLFLMMSTVSTQMDAQCLQYPVALSERVSYSEVVFEGKIIESEGFYNPSRKMIHTAYKVKVTKIFKGEIRTPFVVVYTEGGVIGNKGLTVHPSHDLKNGDVGVFLANPSEMPNPYDELPCFKPSGQANAFIRYNLDNSSAFEPFFEYKNIVDDLYTKLNDIIGVKYTITSKLVLPEKVNHDQAMVPGSITFAPASINAGAFAQLTISGTGFGPGGGSSAVNFKNADDGGSTYISIPFGNPHIISWSATQIVIIVPQRAGTGTIQVLDNVGAIGTSAANLTIPYAIINSGTPGVVRHQCLQDLNYSGGYTLSLNTTSGFAGDAAAVASFRRALTTWRCATYVNFSISTTNTTADYTNTSDTINSICFDIAGNRLTGGTLGVCYSAWTLPFGCNIAPGGATGIKTSLDLVFRHPVGNPPPQPWSFTLAIPPGINWYDFQSVALHELGHGHELGHVIEPTFEVMNYSISNGATRRSVVGNATAGGNFVMARSTSITPMLGCNVRPHQAITPSECNTDQPSGASGCVANASILTGCAPLTVNFTGSTNVPIAGGWYWNINYNGDGSPPGPPNRTQIEYWTRNCSHTFTVGGTYVVKMYAGGTNGYCSATVTIVVSNSFAATLSPLNPPPTCGTVLLTATNDINFTYQWRLNGVDIPGANANTYSAAASGNYTVFIQQGSCSQLLGPAVVVVDPTTVGGTLNGGGAVCANGNSGTMTLAGYVGSILEWQMSTDNFVTFTTIPNTTPNQNYLNINVPTQYRVRVKSGSCPEAFSTIASFTVNPPTIPGTIAPIQSAHCSGSNSGSLVLSGNQGNILRWESSSNNFGTVTNIPNVTATLNYTNLTQTTQYRVVVQNPGCAVLNSSVATVTIYQTPGYAGNITGPSPVCQQSVKTYIVPSTPGVSYDWTVSPAGPNLSPAGNTCIVSWGLAPQGNYTLTVTPRIANCFGPPSNLDVRVNAIPQLPNRIDGPVAQCLNEPGFYSIPPVLGATSYTWTNSCGWTGSSNTNAISYVATNLSPCTISVQAFGPCGSSGILSLNVVPITLPNQSSTITGPASVCQEDSSRYSVVNVPGVSYSWNGLPPGSFFRSGQGTNEVMVYWGSAVPGNYTITVTPQNPCGNGQPTSTSVNINSAPGQPSQILGTISVCQNTPETYGVNFQSGVTYNWSIIPGGNTLVNNGNTAIVNWTNPGTYVMSVTANNQCGPSQAQYLTVVVTQPRVANAGVNVTTCSMATTVMGSPAGGRWSCVNCPNGTILTQAGNFGFLSNMQSGTLNVLMYSLPPNGPCPGSQSTITVMNQAPQAGYISGPSVVCSGDNITLTLNGSIGNILRWEVSTNNGGAFTPIQNQSTILNYVAGNTNLQFRVVLGGGNCPTVVTQTQPIRVNRQVQAAVQNSNITVCTDNVNIFALDPGQNVEGVWSFVSGPATANITSTGVMGLVSNMTLPGVYRFRWKIDNAQPCSPTFAETFVTRLENTTQAYGGPDQTLCTDNVTLNGNIPLNGTGVWSLLSSPIQPTISGSNPIQVSNMTTPGVYVFEYRITNPPCAPTYDQVFITILGGNSQANAGNDQTICSDNTIVVGNNPSPGTGSWSFVSGPRTASIQTMGRNGIINGMTQPGEYFFRWDVNNSQCGQSSDIIKITVLDNTGTARVLQSQVSICGTTTGTVTAISPGQNAIGSWSFVSGPVVATISTNGVNGVISGMTANGDYVFRWTVSGQCGTTTADVRVRRETGVPQAFAGSNQTICDSQSALVTGNTPPQGATGKWAFVSGPAPASVTTIGIFGSIVGMSSPGTYLFSWTIYSNNSCPNSSAVVAVTRKAPPSPAQVSGPQSVCGNTAILTGNTPQIGTGLWSFVGGPIIPNMGQQGVTATVTGMVVPGNYRFRWTISNPPCTPTSKDISIIVSPGSVPGNLSGGGTFCANNNSGNIYLSGYQGSIVRWESSTDNFVTTNFIANQNSVLSFFNLTRTTSFRAIVKQGPCPEVSSNIVTVNIISAPTQAIVPPNQVICGTNITLLGNLPQVGTPIWEFQSGPITPGVQSSNNVAIITGMNIPGNYIFQYSILNSCGSSSGRVMITVNPPTVGGNTGTNRTFCSSNNSGIITLSGHTGSVIRWEYSEDNFATPIPISNTLTTQGFTNLLTTTKFRAVVKSGTCPVQYSGETEIVIRPSIVADAGTDQNICGNIVTLYGNDPMGNQPTWSFVSGPSVPNLSQNGNIAMVSNLAPGNYIFEYKITTPGCNPTTDYVNVVVGINPSGGSVTGLAQVCTGSTGRLVVSGFVGNIVRWERSTNAWQTTENIANPTAEYTYFNITQTTQFRAVTSGGVCGEVVSSSFTVNITQNPTIADAGPAKSVCANGSVTLLGNQPNIGTPSWSFVGGPITPQINSSGNTAFISGLTTEGVYTFKYTISNAPCNASSSNVSITVMGTPQAGNVVGNATVCVGNNNGLLNLTNYSGDVIRWESSIDNFQSTQSISNTNSAYFFNNLNTTTSFRAVVSRTGCGEVFSTPTTITVGQPSIGGVLNGSTDVCISGNSGSLNLSGNVGNVIRWEISTDNFLNYTFVPGNASVYNYNNLTVTTQFRAVVQSGTCAAATSSVATVNVTPTTIPGILTGNSTVCYGSNQGVVTLSGNRGNVLRWEISNDNFSTFTSLNNQTLNWSYSNLTQTVQVRAVVKSGACPEDLTNTAVIQIDQASNPGNLSSNMTVCGQSNAGTLTLSGNFGTILRWESSSDNFVTINSIANVSNVLVFNDLLRNTRFRVIVKPANNCPIVNSNSVEVTVLPAVQAGSVTGPVAVCSPVNVGTLTLTGYLGTVVNWEFSTDNFLTFTSIPNNTATYVFSNLTRTTQFRAKILNGSCPITASQPWNVEVGQGTQPGIITGNVGGCGVAANGTLNIIGNIGNVLYWESSEDNFATMTTINNPSTQLSYQNIIRTTKYRAYVQSPGCAIVRTGEVSVEIDQLPSGGALYQDATVCYENNGGTLYTIGNIGQILRWESSTDNFQTVTTINNTLSYNVYNGLTQTTSYRVVARTGNVCPEAYSNVVTITVRPQILLQVTSSMGCNGLGSVLARAEGGSGNYTYNISPAEDIANTLGEFNNLPPNTYMITAVDENGCMESVSVILSGQPSAPQISRITNITTSSAVVQWLPVPPGHGVIYSIRYRILGSSTWTIVNNITLTYLSLTNLQNNTTYEVELAYKCNVNSPLSPFSTGIVRQFTTQSSGTCAGTPPVPGGIYINNITSTQAVLNWNIVPGASGYVISYGLASQNPNSWPIFLVCNPGNQFMMSNLQANSNYRVKIRTNCTQCNNLLPNDRLSVFSQTFEFTTPIIKSGDLDLNTNEISIYPNPNRGSFVVSFESLNEEDVHIKLLDISGKEILSNKLTSVIGENAVPFELNQYASGVYLLQITIGNVSKTLKVIVE